LQKHATDRGIRHSDRKSAISPVRIGERDAFSSATEHRSFVARHVNERLPFIVVPAAAQLSALLPPGITAPLDFWLSTGLLALMVLLWLLLPRVVPQGSWVLGAPLLTSCLYTASIALLIGSTNAARSGFAILLMLPVVGVALYGDLWESAIIVPSVAISVTCLAIVGRDTATVVLRQLTFFFVVGAMISLSIQLLRARLVASNRRKRRLLSQSETLALAAEKLSVLSSPDTIVALGAELGARIGLPPDQSRLGLYLRIDNGFVSAAAAFDESDPGVDIELRWPLADHPTLAAAVAAGTPVLGSLRTDEVGPTLRSVAERCGMTHGAWIPIRPGGELHGVLAIADRDQVLPEDAFHQCVAVGHLLELALSNWLAHERLEEHARNEERRRIARELHDGMAHELAYMATKARTSATASERPDDMVDLANAADRALDEARRAITILSARSPESLQSCITQTTEDMCLRFGIRAEFHLDRHVALPSQETENLLRIIREAVTNAARHGAASCVTVRLAAGPGVRLAIHDDGCGFDMAVPSRLGGFGLLSMQERAKSMGARFAVASAPGQGTAVEVLFP